MDINLITGRYPSEQFLKLDGFDDAIIGVEENNMRLIYSVSKCIDILLDDMDYKEAVEYFEFNISSGHVGKKTPVFCYDDF